MWKKRVFYTAIFCIGAAGYAGLELLWRGYTHWSMALCGGICLTLLHVMDRLMAQKDIWKKSAAGCLLITGVEFIAGCILNLWFGLNIWDYSDTAGNFLGQICLPFMLVWFVLCIFVFSIMRLARRFRIKRIQEGYYKSTNL